MIPVRHPLYWISLAAVIAIAGLISYGPLSLLMGMIHTKWAIQRWRE